MTRRMSLKRSSSQMNAFSNAANQEHTMCLLVEATSLQHNSRSCNKQNHLSLFAFLSPRVSVLSISDISLLPICKITGHIREARRKSHRLYHIPSIYLFWICRWKYSSFPWRASLLFQHPAELYTHASVYQYLLQVPPSSTLRPKSITCSRYTK